MAMGEIVSEEQVYNIDETAVETSSEQQEEGVDLKYELYIQYRLVRKKISAFIRETIKKNFSNILYITAEAIPTDFIIKLQRQYPDKVIQVLIPLFEEDKSLEKTTLGFDYFLQNKNYNASVYRIPYINNGIKVYGIYTKKFSEIKHFKDIYNIKYLAHFTKIARKVALKLKPDLIQADNIPLLMGLELGSRWTSGYPIKFIQSVHNLSMYDNIESFWAAINIANKNEMKRIQKDTVIQKNLAILFNIEFTKKFKKFRGCLNYLYKHYDEYRTKVSQKEQTKENIILGRLNERINKLFPNISIKYNPAQLSYKKANGRIINSLRNNNTIKTELINNYNCLIKKSEQKFENKIKHSFDISNFREARSLNNKYLIREFSEKRIETKFIDLSLFTSNEININGYLDSFYKAPLIFVPFNEYVKESDIKTASIAILKLFELRKNIQVIFNMPKDLNSQYLKALFEFFASQNALNGKWLAIEGNLNIPQFMSSSDIMLIPSGECLNIENTLFAGLKYGCIPIVSNDGICGNIIKDIFDDMNTGCGFKAEKIILSNNEDFVEKEREVYTNAVLRALKFMIDNKASWNLLIENAMKYDSSWDFRSIEKYNNLYEDII